MINWIMGNLATIIISLVLAAIFVLVIIYLINNKRKGNSSCGCGCAGCPKSDSCAGNNPDESKLKK